MGGCIEKVSTPLCSQVSVRSLSIPPLHQATLPHFHFTSAKMQNFVVQDKESCTMFSIGVHVPVYQCTTVLCTTPCLLGFSVSGVSPAYLFLYRVHPIDLLIYISQIRAFLGLTELFQFSYRFFNVHNI